MSRVYAGHMVGVIVQQGGTGQSQVFGTVTASNPLTVTVDGASTAILATSGDKPGLVSVGTRVVGVQVGATFYILETYPQAFPDTAKNYVTPGGIRVQSDNTTVVTVGTVAVNTTVTFATAFASPPVVMCTFIDTGSGLGRTVWGNAAGDTTAVGTTTNFVFTTQRASGSAGVRLVWQATGVA